MNIQRLAITITFLASVTGCATYDPATVSTPAKGSPAESFACATATLNALGYTITDANKDAGFIKAQKARGSAHAFLTGHADSDRITVSIFDDPATKLQRIRVSGDTIATQEMGWQAESVVSQQTTADVKSHIQQLVAACGK